MRILVIEDEKKVARFLEQGLREEKYDVDVAFDGADGLDRALAETYDLIITDLMMPKKSGIEVIQGVRAAGRATPILCLTAKTEVGAKVEGLDAGADDYLTKPFLFEELAARVRSLLRRSDMEKKTQLATHDLVLDTVLHTAKRLKPGSTTEEMQIPLTVKEYELLEFLLRNKGKMISRSVITQHVWGYSFTMGSNVIDVYIKRLREKLDGGRAEAERLIMSERGVGYGIRE
ncbi:MAG: response regulator transcription factor [Bacteroidetes bacterium]|jgi:DNA-binding response OmpR family regulator|nr:response regulator transcription factor [Bacteroidota bacterium]